LYSVPVKTERQQALGLKVCTIVEQNPVPNETEQNVTVPVEQSVKENQDNPDPFPIPDVSQIDSTEAGASTSAAPK
jgi:hypothetical protein